MKRKLCIICGFYPLIKGGAEYQSRILADNLRKDFDVIYISVNADTTKVENIDNIKVYSIHYSLLLNQSTLYYSARNGLKRILEREQPDVIYQRILSPFAFHISQIAQKLKIKHYIHIADIFSLTFGSSGVTNIIKKWMFDKISKTPSKFIAQTKEQEIMLDNLGTKPILQVYNMHPASSLDINKAINIKKEEKIKKIVWIGMSRPVKRLDIFIDIADKLKNNLNLQFVVIGGIDDSEYNLRIKKALNNSTNIEYLGVRDNEFINNYLEKEAYLYINTSDSEGFSNVFIQCWLRGVPVISLNSDPDNILTKYKMGYFCDGNIDHIKYNVSNIIEDNNLYRELSINANLNSTSLFSVDQLIYEYRKLFM